jgi:hypothetical protein
MTDVPELVFDPCQTIGMSTYILILSFLQRFTATSLEKNKFFIKDPIMDILAFKTLYMQCTLHFLQYIHLNLYLLKY